MDMRIGLWVPKNWCFWTVVLEKTLKSLSDCKELQPVSPKGNQSWIGRTDVGAETPILWLPDAKSWLIWKNPDAGKDWRWEEKGMASPTRWAWVWVNSGSWWQTGKPGVLQSMGSQSQTQLSDWTELKGLHVLSKVHMKCQGTCKIHLPAFRWNIINHLLTTTQRWWRIQCYMIH